MSCNGNDDPAEDFKLRTKGNTEESCFVVSCSVQTLLFRVRWDCSPLPEQHMGIAVPSENTRHGNGQQLNQPTPPSTVTAPSLIQKSPLSPSVWNQVKSGEIHQPSQVKWVGLSQHQEPRSFPTHLYPSQVTQLDFRHLVPLFLCSSNLTAAQQVQVTPWFINSRTSPFRLGQDILSLLQKRRSTLLYNSVPWAGKPFSALPPKILSSSLRLEYIIWMRYRDRAEKNVKKHVPELHYQIGLGRGEMSKYFGRGRIWKLIFAITLRCGKRVALSNQPKPNSFLLWLRLSQQHVNPKSLHHRPQNTLYRSP